MIRRKLQHTLQAIDAPRRVREILAITSQASALEGSASKTSVTNLRPRSRSPWRTAWMACMMASCGSMRFYLSAMNDQLFSPDVRQPPIRDLGATLQVQIKQAVQEPQAFNAFVRKAVAIA